MLPRTALEKQVWPDFRFHHHCQARPHAVEEAPDRGRQVVGQIHVEDAIAVDAAHALRTGRRDRGDHERRAGIAFHQRVDQRHRRVDLAHRHRMHPDAVAKFWVAEKSETLAPAREIFRIAQSAYRQPIQDHRREQIHGGGVDESAQFHDEPGKRPRSITVAPATIRRCRPLPCLRRVIGRPGSASASCA